MQAAARGERFTETVGFLRGAVTTLNNAEAPLETAVERINETKKTAAQLREIREQAVAERAEAERQREASAYCVHNVNKTLVATRQAATIADSRRIIVETASSNARQELEDSQTERNEETVRRDALEEVVAQLI